LQIRDIEKNCLLNMQLKPREFACNHESITAHIIQALEVE
jgi:hypothetical protein